MAQGWRSPPTNVARVRFPDLASYVSWVRCWFSTLLWDVFLRVLEFSPLLKNQHFQIPIRSWNAQTFLQNFLWRAYGKPGNLESGSGTGTRIGEINECFKLGSMSDIKTPPPFSAILARWMTKYEYKEHCSYHSFQLDWVGDDALIIQNIFAFASRSRQHQGIGWNVISCEKFLAAQFVQNQNVNTVKTRLVFPTIDRNAEILSGGFNDRFSCCWMYWLLVNFDCRVSSWTTVPVSRGFFLNTIYRS